jgi:hypothetical protein
VSRLGVYCIENWSGRRANRDSVKPLLDYLEVGGVARYVHERVSTAAELEHRLDDWAPRKLYPVCYLALHGSPESVWVGSEEVALEDLLLAAPSLEGKTLFLSSCSTLATSRAWLRKLRAGTRLNTICGYDRDVEWFEGASFDLLLLSALSSYSRPSDAVKYVRREHPGLVKWIGFRTEPDWAPR